MSKPDKVKKQKPLIIKLQGVKPYRRILKGVPQTVKLRCGYVNLKPQELIGEHSTEDKEEVIIVLNGKAKVYIEGSASKNARVNSLIYVPPGTKHNIKNVGRERLSYVYITVRT